MRCKLFPLTEVKTVRLRRTLGLHRGFHFSRLILRLLRRRATILSFSELALTCCSPSQVTSALHDCKTTSDGKRLAGKRRPGNLRLCGSLSSLVGGAGSHVGLQLLPAIREVERKEC
ncbi:hypothetical protein BCR35DRAFT_302662 [Leucosporidium creatinivorum]|uniref:Uncharacterized protein n=1 Tax=Leucosporidium creatinivorum TaxID=106004 RepID=A0A1Y2FPV2_9BASI|nr:hypothetical protein BCR35DRAFT_302662 [Leucosporidium creatinivorum]